MYKSEPILIVNNSYMYMGNFRHFRNGINIVQVVVFVLSLCQHSVIGYNVPFHMSKKILCPIAQYQPPRYRVRSNMQKNAKIRLKAISTVSFHLKCYLGENIWFSHASKYLNIMKPWLFCTKCRLLYVVVETESSNDAKLLIPAIIQQASFIPVIENSYGLLCYLSTSCILFTK